MTLAQLQLLARLTGFPDPALAAAIAMAESNGNPAAVGDGGDSIGLWQIDTRYHPWAASWALTNPWVNARAALLISSQGATWAPWSTAWENAAAQQGYLGPAAPFARYYAAPSPAPSVVPWLGVAAAGLVGWYVGTR